MADKEQQTLFRKETIERISSPEQLNGYLRVTKPEVWIILAAVILLLLGLFAWSTVGVLETTADAKAVIENEQAEVVATGSVNGTIAAGMPLRIASQEYVIASVGTDDYGRTVAYAQTDLPDGIYDAKIVTEQTKPISFLLESR